MWFSKKIAFYKKGLITYPELLNSAEITNKTQLRQMEFALQEKGTYIEKENIRDFLSTLSYPLYFLDFETMQPVIPKYVGTKPYAQIPFQYSLHYIEAEGGKLKHTEFLAESGTDPRRKLAEQLWYSSYFHNSNEISTLYHFLLNLALKKRSYVEIFLPSAIALMYALSVVHLENNRSIFFPNYQILTE